MATILVIGASRGIGLETVKAALEAGHTVRALARSAASITLTSDRLQKIDADATDRAALIRALEGVDAVAQTLGRATSPSMVFTGTDLFSRATRALIDAMRSTSVRRLVVVTGLGAGDSRGHGGLLYDALFFPVFLRKTYDDKDVQEQMVKASGLDWTIVRPGILTDGPANGRARALTDPKTWRAAPVTRADVGRFIVDEITTGAHLRQTPVLVEQP